VVLAHDEWEDCILFKHGGALYDWGIVVGRPGFTPRYRNRYEEIADGIWGYQAVD
jgi:hypothetical protein